RGLQMWRLSTSIAAVAVIVSPLGVAQESLCEPCVDPPMPRRHDSSNPSEVSVITTESMNELGVRSIEAILNSYPKFVPEEMQPNKDDDRSEDSIEADNAVDDPEVPDK